MPPSIRQSVAPGSDNNIITGNFSSATVTGNTLVLIAQTDTGNEAGPPGYVDTIYPPTTSGVTWVYLGNVIFSTRENSGGYYTLAMAVWVAQNAPSIPHTTVTTLTSSVSPDSDQLGFIMMEIQGVGDYDISFVSDFNTQYTPPATTVPNAGNVTVSAPGILFIPYYTLLQTSSYSGLSLPGGFGQYKIISAPGTYSTSYNSYAGTNAPGWSCIAFFIPSGPSGSVLSFFDPAGNPLANGTVTFRLNVDGVKSNHQIAAGRLITATLDSSGSCTVPLVLNSDITPSGTVYFVNAYSSLGEPAWSGQMTF